MSLAESVREVAPSEGKRVLVAEDSPVTQDLLKLMLGQRGHQVDIVRDGEEALQALRSRQYDVALLDFHLPKRDGLQVAAAARELLAGRARPRFVAITADAQGLLESTDDCENFDLIVPKPLDIHEICTVIEEDFVPGAAAAGTLSDRIEAAGRAAAEAAAAEEGAEPGSTGLASAILFLGYQYLSWPDDLDGAKLSARAMRASLGEAKFDAVLVRQPARVQDLAPIWQRKQLHLLPVIDLAGGLGARADLNASRLRYGETAAIEALVKGFGERRAGLHRDLLLTTEIGEKLLGRVLVSGGRLAASYDPNVPEQFCFNAVLDLEAAVRAAEQERVAGNLERELFDRFQRCACGSSRLNVREECAKCRSPDLAEEPYLHHFKCAFQGPQSDFRRGDDLICPKCHQELSHFSVDYDKPGAMTVCHACGHAGSEPAVGFRCLDCGAHSDGDATQSRDIHSYRLTDQALAFLETGRAFLGPAQQTLRFSELPLNLVVALNEQARRFNEDGTPFALFDISYRNEREIVREQGGRQFLQARDLFLENLRNLLRKGDLVVRGRVYDFALLAGVGEEEAARSVEEIHREAAEMIRIDLGVTIQVFGPADFT